MTVIVRPGLDRARQQNGKHAADDAGAAERPRRRGAPTGFMCDWHGRASKRFEWKRLRLTRSLRSMA